MMQQIDPITTLADAHAQWHAIHGKYVVCPLDCGAGESVAYDGQCDDRDFTAPQVACGHCKGRHTVAGVAVCAATHWASRR